MKVKGGLLTYLLIFLGLALGAFLVITCILMFSPGTVIFGLVYMNNNKVTELHASGTDPVIS